MNVKVMSFVAAAVTVLFSATAFAAAPIKIGALFAVTDEVTQILVGRTCDLKDWLADMVGTLIGLAIVAIGVSLVARTNRRAAQL